MCKAVKDALFNLMYAMAKQYIKEHPEECKDDEAWPDEEDMPPLLEDEIAEILDQHKGEEILIHFRPEGALRYRYYEYEHDKSVVFTIYEALENHVLVTVGGTNIVDM